MTYSVWVGKEENERSATRCLVRRESVINAAHVTIAAMMANVYDHIRIVEQESDLTAADWYRSSGFNVCSETLLRDVEALKSNDARVVKFASWLRDHIKAVKEDNA